MPLKSTKFRKQGRFGFIRGGVQPAADGGAKRFITWLALASLTGGTDKACANGTRSSCSLFIPHIVTLTGIGFLVGSVGGTDSVVAELHDADGKLLANSALAGVVVGAAAGMQEVPFTAPVEVVGPGWYYLSLTFNGTTAKFRTLAAATAMASTAFTKAAALTFGTVGDLTPPTTFTADVGPIAYVY